MLLTISFFNQGLLVLSGPKEEVHHDVPTLAMMDDVMGVVSCGDDLIELNAIINDKKETKKLLLGDDKCFKIHVSKRAKKCPQVLKVHKKSIKSAPIQLIWVTLFSENGKIMKQCCKKLTKLLGS